MDGALADAGYISVDNVAAVTQAGIDPLIATGCHSHGERIRAAPRAPIPKGLTLGPRMARRLATKVGRAANARRKAIVKPAFGQMNVVKRDRTPQRLPGGRRSPASSAALNEPPRTRDNPTTAADHLNRYRHSVLGSPPRRSQIKSP